MKRLLLVDLAIDKLGGAERVVNTLACYLAEAYQVDVCSVYQYGEKPFYEYPKKVNRKYLINLSKMPSVKSKSMASFVFFRSVEKTVELAFYHKRIRAYCEKELDKYDVVIFGRTMVAVDFLPYMKKYGGKVIVRDASHLYDTCKKNRKLMKRYFSERVNVFIVSSDESICAYRDFFKDDRLKINKIYNPLGIIPRTADSLNCKQITGVGRYSKQKGFENLIKAFAIVHRKHPDWRLTLLGAGRGYRKYLKLCKRCGIIQFVDFRKSEDITQDYCKTGIYVMSSRYEGYANALVEALACGVPSVSFDWYMGVYDIIEDEKNGCIVKLIDRDKYYRASDDRRNVKNLAARIIYLIENPDVRKSLSENALEIRRSRNPEKIISQWAALIEE